MINNSNEAAGGNWGITVKTELLGTPGLLRAHSHKHHESPVVVYTGSLRSASVLND